MFSLVSLSLFGLLWRTVVCSWEQLGADIDAEASGDYFGYSVSLSADGTIMAVGAPYNDGLATNAGHVRVYKWDTANWNQLGGDINGEAGSDYSGYFMSLSDDGTILAIGAPYNDGTGANAGHVRVYKWNTATWNQLGTDINAEATGDKFGWSVSLSSDGSVLAVGASSNTGGRGHVRVYKWDTTTWNRLGADVDGESASDKSGYSVSLSADGTIMAVGAPYNDGTGSDAGHVRVYKWNTATWNQLGTDIDGEAAGDTFGISVSLSADGSVLAVGAPYNDGINSDAGHVHVYKWDTSTWNRLGADIDGESSSDNSGYSVSLSDDGTILAIGATKNDGTDSDAGHVRVYKWNTTTWNKLGADIDGEVAGDNSGYSVSLSADGTTVAIGAPYSDETGSDAGHVRVFAYYPPTSEPTVQPTETPTSEPTAEPSANPSAAPTAVPSAAPTATPSAAPTTGPTATPTAEPTKSPTVPKGKPKPNPKPKPFPARRLRQEA